VKWLFKIFILLSAGLGLMVGCSPVSFDVDEKSICEDLDEQSCNPINPQLAEFTSQYTVAVPKVDIVIANDNSGTMQYEQRDMGNRFSDFINRLAGFNWQLGITTMDISNANRSANGEYPVNSPGASPNAAFQDGKLIPIGGSYILREGQADALTAFRNAIEITPSESRGYADERGILTAGLALQNGSSTGLVRSDSTHVAVIMLTDEDVRSVGEVTDPAQAAALQGFTVTARDRKEHFASIWTQVNSGRNKTISVHSLIVNDSSCLSIQRQQQQPNGQIITDATYGLMYKDLSQDERFEGIVGNICAINYGSELSRIGEYIATRAVRDVPLNKVCDIITDDIEYPVEITLENSQGTATYNFRLGFDPLPPVAFSSGGSFTEITAHPGRIEFNPGLRAGTKVAVRYTCRF
jgi:hypothetical protein